MDEKTQLINEANKEGVVDGYEAKMAIQKLEDLRLEAILIRQEKEDIMDMRRNWSKWILGTIVAIVLLDFILIFLLGFKLVDFEGWEFPAFIADGVIKIIGLAAIVVNFLFNKDSLVK